MGKRIGTTYIKLFHELTYRFTPWEVWKDFIVMFSCAISNSLDKEHYQEREALYMKTIRKYDSREQAIFPQLCAEVVEALEKNPEQDFLGSIYMELGLGNKSTSQFFTPYHVCVVKAKMLIGADLKEQIEEKGYVSIGDPCCGAGATLIAAIHEAARVLKDSYNWQRHLLFVGQDIDYTSACMCYIQLSLLGAAGYIKIGNTLTEPVTPGDSLDNYWFTPMYQSDIWTMRQIIKRRRLL